MDRLLRKLHGRLDLSRLREWTIEVNPATTSLEYLQMLRQHGVDRISMGAQSFDVAELKTLERHHDPAQVDESVRLARLAGFERVNIDLIYAIPGQTVDSWRQSLQRAVALGLDHYSAYNLTYEPNTAMAVRQRLGQFQNIEESIEIEMLRIARATLADAGAPAYEISNYATPGQSCLHNLIYWTQGDYLGIGPSAASHCSGLRFKNKPHLGEWERSIDQHALPVIEIDRLTPEQRQGEYMMLHLRLSEGVDPVAFQTRFGISVEQRFGQRLDPLIQHGLIFKDASFRITEKGLPVADAIAAEFLR
jgi:oxygen-independent coproporphyrinogen III oxidase